MAVLKKTRPIELGEKVRDTITEYEGICTGIISWLNGCRRIGIQSKDRNTETNQPSDVYWVDEVTIERVEPEPKRGRPPKKEVESVDKERGGPNNSTRGYKEPKY